MQGKRWEEVPLSRVKQGGQGISKALGQGIDSLWWQPATGERVLSVSVA